MENKQNGELKANNLCEYLLYVCLFSIAFNPLIAYIFNVSSLHIIIMLVISLVSIGIIIYRRCFFYNNLYLSIILYVLMVLFGIISGTRNNSVDIAFIVKSASYRIMYPSIFLLYFSVFKNKDELDKLGHNFLVVTNIVTVILALFGIIEKINPEFIHILYGNNLTSHLTLIINEQSTSRLLSLAGNPINLGFYMVIGLSSSLCLCLVNLKKSKALVLINLITLPVYIYVMFYTYSRTAIMLSVVVVVTILCFLVRKINTKNKVLLILFTVILFFLISNISIGENSSVVSRLTTMTITNYFNNTRFSRASEAFSNGSNYFQFFFGHGIQNMNYSPIKSSAIVFELGYASLLYESGLLGLLLVVVSYLKAIFLSIFPFKKSKEKENNYVDIFFISIIISGLVGLFLQDIYMQIPYSLFLWFSSLYLIMKNSSNNKCFKIGRENEDYK